MKTQELKIYKKGHLEGYERGFNEGVYIEKRLKIFSEGFICGLLSGMGIITIILITLKVTGTI